MQRDAIPNATGEEWEWYSEGPDHSKIRAVYEEDPKRWDVEVLSKIPFEWVSIDVPAWFADERYRMKRKRPAKWPKWDKVDPVNRPVHSEPLQRGSDAVNAVDQVRSALSTADFRAWCRGNAMIHMLNLESEGKQAEWALWWMRMSVGDDPRK